MKKCDNCLKGAKYLIETAWAAPQSFCEDHFPGIFNKDALPHFIKIIEEKIVAPVVEAVEEPVKEVKAKVAKKTSKKAE